MLDRIEEAIPKHAYSVAELGIPGLQHFLYKSCTNVQLTRPKWEAPYHEEDEQRRSVPSFPSPFSFVHPTQADSPHSTPCDPHQTSPPLPTPPRRPARPLPPRRRTPLARLPPHIPRGPPGLVHPAVRALSHLTSLVPQDGLRLSSEQNRAVGQSARGGVVPQGRAGVLIRLNGIDVIDVWYTAEVEVVVVGCGKRRKCKRGRRMSSRKSLRETQEEMEATAWVRPETACMRCTRRQREREGPDRLGEL